MTSEYTISISSFESSKDLSQEEKVKKLYGKRYKVISELVNSELSYVRDLRVVVSVFFEPLRDGSVIDSDELSGLFSNIEALSLVSKTLYSDLQRKVVEYQDEDESVMGAATIAGAFVGLCGYLKIYQNYIENFNNAIELHGQLEKKNHHYSKFMTQAHLLDETRGVAFTEFIKKPVQRLRHYQRLFKDLQELTPFNHPDYDDACETYSKVSEVTQHVENIEKKRENLVKLRQFDIDIYGYPGKFVDFPDRHFIKQDSLGFITNQIDERLVYLFSDILMITEPSKKKIEWLENVAIRDIVEAIESHDKSASFTIITLDVNVTYSFRCESNSQKTSWISEINSCVSKYLTEKKTSARTDQSQSIRRKISKSKSYKKKKKSNEGNLDKSDLMDKRRKSHNDTPHRTSSRNLEEMDEITEQIKLQENRIKELQVENKKIELQIELIGKLKDQEPEFLEKIAELAKLFTKLEAWIPNE